MAMKAPFGLRTCGITPAASMAEMAKPWNEKGMKDRIAFAKPRNGP